MSETCKNTLEPTSLIMRPCACFYCGAEDKCVVLIEYSFGIKVCHAHKPRAERDCRAYLHRHGLVRLKDTMEHSEIRRFLDILKAHPFVLVERTNGTIEDDWSLREGNHFEPAFFSRTEDRWGVPLYNKRLNLNKTVPIINFLRSDINGKMTIPVDWQSIIEGVLDILNEGVYKADVEAYDYARNHDESETITETPGVATIIYEGREERIFVGQGRPRENGTDITTLVEEIGDP